MEKISTSINEEYKQLNDSSITEIQWKSKIFSIYCFNGETINIDSDSKHLKSLMTTVEKSYNKNLYTDLLNQKITDINAEAKGKSDIEIKKVIVKKLNWESTLDDTSSVINSKLISINEKQSTLLSNRSNDNYELSHRKARSWPKIKFYSSKI